MQQGDLVVRHSYGGDVTFSIYQIAGNEARLKGVDIRLLADAPVSDLLPASQQRILKNIEEDRRMVRRAVRQFDRSRKTQAASRARTGDIAETAYFEMPGKVLHMDGDYNYLRKSMNLYQELRVPAVGYYVAEQEMAAALKVLLPQVMPDIVVLTGHDAILKERRETDIHNLTSYKHSHHFVNAVKAVRQFDRSRDSLIVIAGACQSHFEALIQAGANFASSPGRVLIHALDPLYIATKIAFTPIRETVHLSNVLHNTLSGLEGMGGLETRGCYRMGIPQAKWQEESANRVNRANRANEKKGN
ncbi:MAG: sporulation peptidase YabG [Gorillibacterium sp.]|nr:sporulation peptidase YabG [Gorillibacterium sp.]